MTAHEISNKQTKKHIDETLSVQELYNIFSNSDTSCSDIYGKMVHVISDYNSEIDKDYENDMEKSN